MVRKELFHAMIVHYPIALLVFSYAFFILWRAAGNKSFGQASYWSLLAGAGGALAAAISGFAAANIAPHTEQAHRILERFHQPIGLTVMSFSVALAVWGVLSRWRFSKATSAIFIAMFTALIGLLAATGYYGGQMVYEHGMAISTKGLCSGHGPHNHGDEEKDAAEKDDHAGHDMHDMKDMPDMKNKQHAH